VDGHKYLFNKRAIVYGDEDLVVGLTSFLAEVGVVPVLCASGGRSGRFKSAIEQVVAGTLPQTPEVHEGMDFYRIEELALELSPDLLIGNSKGYGLARKLGIPLVRVGFPIHDRFGAQRTLHVGYRGTQSLLDRTVNAIIDANQNSSPVGYAYM
jgi:nitrogenase molybdenum-iron protein NifN